MIRVTLDEALRSKLNGLNDQVEVCDEAGRTLGHFLPADLYHEMMYAWLKTQTPDEEIERLRQQTGGRPLAEIWKTLGRA